MSRVLRLCAALALLDASAALAQLVDLNTATKEELESLPGIGEKMADEILQRRPIGTIEDLLTIPNFGQRRLERIRELVSIDGEAVPGLAEGEPESEPAAKAPAPAGQPRRPEAKAPAPGWTPPAGMKALRCWRCLQHFCVEAATEAGICPYCGVRWAQRRAEP
jgi:hypothetical protein